MTHAAVRLLHPEEPLDLLATLRPLAGGGGDPTWRFDRSVAGGRVTHALWTPDGAATVQVTRDDRTVRARAAGPGRDWLLDRVDWMVGLHDDPGSGWQDLHPVVADVVRRRPGLRMGRTLRVAEAIVHIPLGQRVTTAEARASWRGLVWRHGHAAPGTDEVRLPPRPATLARLGDADWHRLGVERGRADAVRGLVRNLPALQRTAGEPAVATAERTATFRRIAESIRRVGPWTSTALAAACLGDPDVVQLGDLHIPHGVCNALAGEPRGSDERMLELLEPMRPQRGRVVRLLKFSGRGAAPRRGPRYAPLPIARM